MELLYHVPLSIWAIGALLRGVFLPVISSRFHCLTSTSDDPLVPVHLLIFSVQAGMSTLTCCVEFMSWSGYLAKEKIALAQLYVPYLALGRFSAASFDQ